MKVVIIGAGPIGLSAAANLLARGLDPMVLEAGAQIAASIRSWGHVRFFTPWEYLLDPAGQQRLETTAWTAPDLKQVPTGKQFVEAFLEPLASTMQEHIHLHHRVVSVSRVGHDLLKDGRRDEAPFLLVVDTPQGRKRITADAVLDASGTWTTPNPLGAGGVEADGELEHSDRILTGIPDVLGTYRDRYAGKRTVVIGAGHSAIGAVLDLVELAKTEPDTLVAWAVRRKQASALWGGGANDELPARGLLGQRVKEAVTSGAVHLLTSCSFSALRPHAEGVVLVDVEGRDRIVVDEIIVATGSRPDLNMLRELRLELDLATESTRRLGPLIDPNHHSCGSVPPHGAVELAHPEKNFFVVGMKSYGRAPTFLMRTGYEQVRSVAAELAGDHEAARRVELKLPQTGVCSTDLAYGAACC